MSGLEFKDDKTNITDLSATFYSHFQAVKDDISARLESLRSAPNANEKEFDSVSSDIVKLRKELIDATTYLPSYDQRRSEQQLKALEESLSHCRAPRSKFAFKRKPANTESASPSAAPPPIHTPRHTPTIAPSTPTLTLSSHTSARLTLSSLVLPDHSGASARSSDITLTDLNTCIVDLFTPQAQSSASGGELTITAIHGHALRRVMLVIPPIEGSVLLYNVQDSVIVVGCHQFRMHDSSNTTVLLHVLSTPIIESSNNIQFGDYPAALRNASKSTQSFFVHPSQHASVQDFDWIKSSASPNWSILTSSTELGNKVIQHLNAKIGLDAARVLDDILLQ